MKYVLYTIEWNHLHPYILNATSVECFKSSLTRDLDINELMSKSHYYSDWISADHVPVDSIN